MGKPETKKVEPLTEISRPDLQRQDAIYFLGLMAARSLETLGQVTFLMSQDDKVAIANPTHVYLDAKAVVTDDPSGKSPPFRWVRPILGQGRPQYVAWKNGELWEIEFEEPYESEQAESSEPHP